MSAPLVTQLARALNLPPDAARHTLDHLVATLCEQLDATGQAQVPGLGEFRRDENGLRFHPDDALARAVNHRYAGLRPIEASPSASRSKSEPEEAPEEEPYDPFAHASPRDLVPEEEGLVAEEPEGEEAEAEPDFQPLESFIAPDIVDEEDIPSEVLDQEQSDTPDVAPTEEEAIPPEEADPSAGAFPFEQDLPEGDELLEEEEPLPSEEVSDEDYDLDDLVAGTWTEGPDTPEDEHVLGPLPSSEVEDADYSLVEPDESLEETDEAHEALPFDTEHFEEPEADAYFSEEPEESMEEEALPSEPPPLAEATPPEPEEPPLEPASEDAPVGPHTVAPAVAATAASSEPSADRSPPARRRGVPIVLTVLGVVLGLIALLWLLNREPEPPVVAEQVPADTAAVAEGPPPAVDSLAAEVPADSAVAAETPPETEEPAVSDDPLRSTAGIDPTAGGFTWVVASEINRAVAERRVARYREQGLRADVVAQEAGGRTRYRVSLGQFASIAEAEARRADLPADVPSDSWILRL